MKCFTRVDFTTNHHPFPDVQKGLSLDLATPACISSAWIWQQCTNPGAPQTGALCSMRGQSWKPRLWLGTACGSSPSASTAPAPGSTSRAHPPHGTHHWKQVCRGQKRLRLTSSQPEEEGTPGWCLTGNPIFLLSFLILNTPCCVFLMTSFYVMSKSLKRQKKYQDFPWTCQHSCCLPLTEALNFWCQLASSPSITCASLPPTFTHRWEVQTAKQCWDQFICLISIILCFLTDLSWKHWFPCWILA